MQNVHVKNFYLFNLYYNCSYSLGYLFFFLSYFFIISFIETNVRKKWLVTEEDNTQKYFYIYIYRFLPACMKNDILHIEYKPKNCFLVI